MMLHLVFHDIVKEERDIKSRIDITLEYFIELLRKIDEKLEQGKTKFTHYTLHFDEGYISFKQIVYPHIIHKPPNQILLAIRTGSIGHATFLNAEDITKWESILLLIPYLIQC